MKILRNKQTGEFLPWPRDNQADIVGLDTSTLAVYTLTQQEKPTFDSSTHYLRKTETINETAKTVTRGWELVPHAAQPVVVTMRSLQLALVDASLYQVVTELINSIPDATDKLKTQIYWAKSATVDRQHPVVLGLVAALAANGVTEAQVDAVFSAAQELDNPA